MTKPTLKIPFHDDLFNLSLDSHEVDNRRKTTRYIRNDFAAMIISSNLFGLKKYSTRINDISSQGASVSVNQKLAIKSKVTLYFRFKTGKIFKIEGRVVRQCKTSTYCYGIKFTKQENSLGDYLLETQTDLLFK
ncbi:MAG: hypothetical protein CVV13_13520 [Gammaproteobacteria bacterium HGW-Gammaproteobacteria-3]|jgi:hypothetical protein|nr:MAG: hypothetical protein CVV13_13520 [Gammaproteobacteria bacterium HGW-Gammaproteobacteria-3]